MVNRLAVQALKEAKRSTPVVVVITDPVTLHRAWIEPEVTQVIVATEEAKKYSIEYGMPENKIQVKGMPIDPSFSERPEKKGKLRLKNGLKTDLYTVLIMGGGEGGGGMEELIRSIDESTLPVQLMIICGRNKKLEKKLKDNAGKYRIPMKVYGFTNQVPEIMAASDLIVTKAGPGTIAEALAMDLPIILTSWLPGQEECKVEFVVKEKVGKVSSDPKHIAQEIAEMMKPENVHELKRNISRVRRPQAAFEIAKSILDKLK
jgi:1,2-diacylglycerol 3-beta-galactosyltransferase